MKEAFRGTSRVIEDRLRVLEQTVRGFNKYTLDSKIELAIKTRKAKEIDEVIVGICDLFFSEQLLELAKAGAAAVQRTIVDRATSTHKPGTLKVSGGSGGQDLVEQQVRSELVPLLEASPGLLKAMPGYISLGLISLSLLSQVHITHVTKGSEPFPTSLEASEGERSSDNEPRYDPITDSYVDPEHDPLPFYTYGFTAGDFVEGNLTIKGRSSADRRAVSTESPYIHTWQIAEFGTGIFASHPAWGWGKRLMNDPGRKTKVGAGEDIPFGRIGGGSWYLNPKVMPEELRTEVLGQEGGHFLFGPKGDDSHFAIIEYRQAIKAILAEIDARIGFGGSRRRG